MQLKSMHQVVSDKTDLKEKEIGHVENVAHIVDIAKKVTVRTIMAPQEQYEQLCTLKKDKRFVLWALYIKRISLLKLDLEMEDGEPHNSSKTTGKRYFPRTIDQEQLSLFLAFSRRLSLMAALQMGAHVPECE
jgi:hypothetical protein